MRHFRQLFIHTAVFLGAFLLTLAFFWLTAKDPPPARMMLNPSTLVQIEVPIELLPVPDLASPVYGVSDGRVEWVAEDAAGDLNTIFTGQPPQAWPEVKR